MHSISTHVREHRRVDWPAAAVAGFAAGAVLMVLDLLWSIATTGEGPWATSHRIAAIVTGSQAAASTQFSVGVVAIALLAHYALGIAFGLVLAAVSSPLRLDATIGIAIVTGAVFGLALYLVNFYGIVHFFPWFADMRGWTTLAAHLVFGIVAALLYWKLERRGEGGKTAR